MTKLQSFYALSLAAGQVLGTPTPPHRRDELAEGYKWPNYCEDKNFRDATLLNHPDVFGLLNPVRLYTGDNYQPRNNQNEDVPLPVWLARWHRIDFEWTCDGAGCHCGSNFIAACKESPVSGYMGVALEQFTVLYSYLRSLSHAIENQRGYMQGKIPKMFDVFGAELKEGVPWDKVIGTITAGVGVLATAVSGPAGGIISSGFGLAGSIAGFLIPEEEKEKKFDWFSDTSAGFADNVNVIMKAIDSWIDANYMKPIDDIKSYIEQEGNLFFAVGDGKFAADPAPPLVSPTDSTILAGLAAPLINRLMQDSQHAVVVFDGKAWREKGFDLCGDPNLKYYEDIQPDGRYCDADGNLSIIMRYAPQVKGKWMHHDHARDVKGLAELGEYGTNRHQIIEGSLENFKAGGFGYGLAPAEAIERLRGMAGIEQVAWGKINVWNLPVCFTGPRHDSIDLKFMEQHIEEWMAASMDLNCGGQRDVNGVLWPYGDYWCGHQDDGC